MKFPRNARIFRGHLDAAPVASVFFILVMFLVLGSLVYTPGVRLQLPVAGDLPGIDKPTVAVAIDANGRLFYENQEYDESALGARLRAAAMGSSEPLTLLIQADKAVSYQMLIRLTMLARNSGISNAWLATLSRPFGSETP